MHNFSTLGRLFDCTAPTRGLLTMLPSLVITRIGITELHTEVSCCSQHNPHQQCYCPCSTYSLTATCWLSWESQAVSFWAVPHISIFPNGFFHQQLRCSTLPLMTLPIEELKFTGPEGTGSMTLYEAIRTLSSERWAKPNLLGSRQARLAYRLKCCPWFKARLPAIQ